MSIKETYKNDLLKRYGNDHTFTETPDDSRTKVEFKDGSSVLVDEATRLVVDDAYKAIRLNLIGTLSEFHAMGSGVWMIHPPQSIQTTDATQTTIDSVTLEDDSVCIVRIHVTAIEDDGSNRGTYIYTGTIYRNGGGATIQGAVTTDHTAFSIGSWSVDITVSGNDVRASVTGAISTTINWQCTIQVMES